MEKRIFNYVKENCYCVVSFARAKWLLQVMSIKSFVHKLSQELNFFDYNDFYLSFYGTKLFIAFSSIFEHKYDMNL